jgi:hypothetical protein
MHFSVEMMCFALMRTANQPLRFRKRRLNHSSRAGTTVASTLSFPEPAGCT